MSLRLVLILAAAAVPAAAVAQAKDPNAALLESCSAHKFETTIDVLVDGKPKKSKMKLCGQEGQTKAEWIGTLKDALNKVAGNSKMPASVKSQIVTALNGEIARLSGPTIQAPPPTFSLGKPSAPPPPPRAAATPPPEYAALPPMPAPRPASAAPAATASAPLLSKPRLSIQCLDPNDIAGEGPCTGFERDTLVTIRASEDLPKGTSLRFVRGNATADIALAGLKRGKSKRVPLPREVCAGVGGGRLEVQTVRHAPAGTWEQVVDTDGPYNLRC